MRLLAAQRMMRGMGIHPGSKINLESEETRKRNLEADAKWMRERQFCICRKFVAGPTYLRHVSCRLCGRLKRKSA